MLDYVKEIVSDDCVPQDSEDRGDRVICVCLRMFVIIRIVFTVTKE